MFDKLKSTNAIVITGLWAAFVSLYAISVNVLEHVPRPSVKDQFSIAVPAPIQVIMAGGDRYLAANLAVFRALVVGTGQLDAETYKVLGQVQKDASKLNPAHEDNYYISQAILPWNDQVDADMHIQQAATDARKWDAMPPFFLGFDKYYFLKDSAAGAEDVRVAAERSPAGNREMFLAMAARWYEKGNDPRVAMGMIQAMASNTRDKDLKKHLELRLTRLRSLAALQDAAKKFTAKEGRSPRVLKELVDAGLLTSIPEDPFGQGYSLDSNGIPTITKPTKANQDDKK